MVMRVKTFVCVGRSLTGLHATTTSPIGPCTIYTHLSRKYHPTPLAHHVLQHVMPQLRSATMFRRASCMPSSPPHLRPAFISIAAHLHRRGMLPHDRTADAASPREAAPPRLLLSPIVGAAQPLTRGHIAARPPPSSLSTATA